MRPHASAKPPLAAKRWRMSPAERRQHILDAARRLFFDRCWDAVTIADGVAERRLHVPDAVLAAETILGLPHGSAALSNPGEHHRMLRAMIGGGGAS